VDATELTLVTGDRYRIEGSLEDVENVLIAASRGAIMQLAWLTESPSLGRVGINPASIVSLRAVDAEAAPPANDA